MTKEQKVEIDNILSDMECLDKNLTERVEELYKIQGAQGERHAFIYYRSQLWECRDRLIKLIQ
jgi:hypothetical protein